MSNESFFFRGLIIFSLINAVGILYFAPIDPVAASEPLNFLDYLGIVYLLVWLLSLILLFRFNRVGRPLFTIIIALGIFLMLALPPYAQAPTNVYQVFNWLAGAVDGAILVMLYLTSVSDQFSRLKLPKEN